MCLETLLWMIFLFLNEHHRWPTLKLCSATPATNSQECCHITISTFYFTPGQRRFVFTIIGCISSIAWQNCICPTIATLARNNHHHLHHFSSFDASAPCHCCHNFRLFNYRHLLVAAVHIAPYLCAIASVTTATSPS